MGGDSVAELTGSRAEERIKRMLAAAQMENGWNKPEPSMWPLPRKRFVPAHWSYARAREILDAAGELISTELAERRNLILANPIVGNHYPTVSTIVTAYQMVKAGETARSHRHSANALRLVLDAEPNAFTIVEGKKIPMEPGDVLLTPNWHWHGHSNESRADAYWMDFLDMPLVHFLGPMFFEHHPATLEQAQEIAARSPARFAWADTLRRLDAAADLAPGRREIALGAPAMATIDLHVWRIAADKKFATDPVTCNAVFAVMQGRGKSVVDGRSFLWERGDVIAAPTGSAHRCEAFEESILLRVSDESLFRHLGWLRPIPPAEN